MDTARGVRGRIWATTAPPGPAMTGFSTALPSSRVVGIYGPWYYASDPGSTAGAMRLTAPADSS